MRKRGRREGRKGRNRVRMVPTSQTGSTTPMPRLFTIKTTPARGNRRKGL